MACSRNHLTILYAHFYQNVHCEFCAIKNQETKLKKNACLETELMISKKKLLSMSITKQIWYLEDFPDASKSFSLNADQPSNNYKCIIIVECSGGEFKGGSKVELPSPTAVMKKLCNY